MISLPFSDFFQMSRQGTYWCHTLIEQKQSTRKRKLLKKLNRVNPTFTNICQILRFDTKWVPNRKQNF